MCFKIKAYDFLAANSIDKVRANFMSALERYLESLKSGGVLFIKGFHLLWKHFKDYSTLLDSRELPMILELHRTAAIKNNHRILIAVFSEEVHDKQLITLSDTHIRLIPLPLENAIALAKHFLNQNCNDEALKKGLLIAKSFFPHTIDLYAKEVRRECCFAEEITNKIPDEILKNAANVVVKTRLTRGLPLAMIPNVKWSDIGGLGPTKDEILDTIQLPLKQPQLFTKGIKKRRGILLVGPPGTGKTLLAKAVATECQLHFLSVKGPELLNMYVGESESNIRNIFKIARDNQPSLLFFDEIDALAPARSTGHEASSSGGVMDRVVSQLLTELDTIGDKEMVFVMGATNRPDLLDSALKRPGRFDKIISFGMASSTEQITEILKAQTRTFKMDPLIELQGIAKKIPRPVSGADIYAMCASAVLNAIKGKIELLKNQYENKKDPEYTFSHYVNVIYPEEDTCRGLVIEKQHFQQALIEYKKYRKSEMQHS
jgi:SpoVK/Ycf46/Vps4 family AAA+-type ATPase